jgi:nucleotide-binding universal stress UspA family protein
LNGGGSGRAVHGRRLTLESRSAQMSYAAMMVHIDAERASERRIELAAELAGRFRAALIGVMGLAPGLQFTSEVAIIDEEPGEEQRRELNERLKAAETSFRSVAAAVRDLEWRSRVELPLELVVRESRAADLVIVGRDRAPVGRFLTLDPATAVLRAGRPVLAVPEGTTALPARRVIIAWKDAREARRAVRDALPFLKDADEVMIVEVREDRDDEEAQTRLEDVIKFLARHRVAVGAKVYLRSKESVARTLLHFAEEERAGLLVAGAYGHSRLGEWAFGGVTRDLLAESPVCCLLSH